VAEEKAGDLLPNPELRDKVVKLVNTVQDEPLSQESVLTALDSGAFSGSATSRFWTLDPIDGTKGFLRAEQYAVCLALIENGKVVLGVLGCPNLPLDLKKPDGEKGCLFVAVEGQGAFSRGINEKEFRKISTGTIQDTSQASFVESVEAAHSNHDHAQIISTELGIKEKSVRMDSQAKYGVLARGDSQIYLRLPTSPTYREKIWDHAAGWLIVREAGGEVSDTKGEPLNFGVGRTLANNMGVIASAASIHAPVISVVRRVLYPS